MILLWKGTCVPVAPLLKMQRRKCSRMPPFSDVPGAHFSTRTAFTRCTLQCVTGPVTGGGGRGGAKPPLENVLPPLEKCFGQSSNLLDIMQRFWAPLTLRPHWCPKLVAGLCVTAMNITYCQRSHETKQFITAKISGNALKQGSRTSSVLRQRSSQLENIRLRECRVE